ncbi:MAG: diguanylate cyclase domain-containing protein, partial [Geminicoccales bacterium]
VLLDLALPDAHGLEAVGELRDAAPNLALLVMSGVEDERLALEAMLNGAQDYLIKGHSDSGLVRRAIRHAIERKRIECELSHLAQYDPLTGLPNRRLLQDRLAQALRRMNRRARLLALVLLDLDGFKAVNDRYGHAVGDRLLVAVAARLRRVARRTDTISRLGGDEFLMVVEGLQSPDEAAHVAEKVLASLGEPFRLGGTVIDLSASLGITIASHAHDAPDVLTREADEAMYRAKSEGGKRYRFHDPAPAPRWEQRLSA